MAVSAKRAAKKIVKDVFKQLGIGVVNYQRLRELEDKSRVTDYLGLLMEVPASVRDQLVAVTPRARSQFGQDLFVLSELGLKRDGFFVEFGATDGFQGSNTFLLEKEFGWKGILAEPARGWHKALKENRSCHIETRCVWTESNSTVRFKEADIRSVSTIDAYTSSDLHEQSREKGRCYDVPTISLQDLLDKYNAPKLIDYLSIDTEGSEFDILKTLDFDRYAFRVITCEHNYAPLREEVFALL